MFKILIVEDDLATNKLMSIVLKNAGYNPVTTLNASDGLNIVKTQKPDLIIADVMLPDFDGFSLTKKIREFDEKTPIIIVTAKQSLNDKRYGFVAGADDYMTKPVDEEELLLRIKVHLKRTNSPTETTLSFGNTIIDYAKMSAFVNGKDVNLTQKEFLLLFKLCSFMGKIFTRNEIMQEIWGNVTQDDHTLNVHVKSIRDKLVDSDGIEIKSMRGLGYKAVEKNGK